MDDLDRLYQRLARAVRDGAPHLLDRRFRLGDVSQHLLPYRLHRRELGFESIQQYERALVRLAAGERGYLSADAAVQHAFRDADDDGPAAIEARLRRYADALVALTPEGRHRPEGERAATPAEAPAVGGATDPAATDTAMIPTGDPVVTADEAPDDAWARPTPLEIRVVQENAWASSAPNGPPNGPPNRAPDPVPDTVPNTEPHTVTTTVPAAAPEAPADTARRTPIEARPAQPPQPQLLHARPNQTPPPAMQSDDTPSRGTHASSCRYCGHALPTDRPVTFCPYCGENLTVQRCPACGTELDVDWQFCITCGRPTGAAGADARDGGTAGASTTPHPAGS